VDYLAAQPRVWLRVAASRLDGDWQLSLLEIAVCEPPPGWLRLQRWNYERAVFIAFAPAGKTVATWLTRERIALPSLSIRLQLEGSVGVERRDSKFQGIYQQLPWPTWEWTVHLSDSSGQTLHDELVAADTPAFIAFDEAAGAFFGVALKPNRNFSGREIVVRQQDRRARIDTVLVRPTELAVKVSGEQLQGASLTLSGATSPTRLLSRRTRQVRLSTPKGLGPGAWLALRHPYPELVIEPRSLKVPVMDIAEQAAEKVVGWAAGSLIKHYLDLAWIGREFGDTLTAEDFQRLVQRKLDIGFETFPGAYKDLHEIKDLLIPLHRPRE
jgi:hypothetical protein